MTNTGNQQHYIIFHKILYYLKRCVVSGKSANRTCSVKFEALQCNTAILLPSKIHIFGNNIEVEIFLLPELLDEVPIKIYIIHMLEKN